MNMKKWKRILLAIVCILGIGLTAPAVYAAEGAETTVTEETASTETNDEPSTEAASEESTEAGEESPTEESTEAEEGTGDNSIMLTSLEDVPMLTANGDNSLHDLNIWTSSGGHGSSNMTVYKNSSTSVSAPQIMYAWIGGDSYSLFCIDYGKAAGTGDSYATKSDYDNLNRNQQKAIAYVLGCAQRIQAPRYNGGYNDFGGENTFSNFQLYVSTQLMIWYYIDQYYTAGTNEGITWDGVVATCNAGWGNLAECQRIKGIVDNLFTIPSFTTKRESTAPTYELEYNPDTKLYETILHDTNSTCTIGKFTWSGDGLTFTRCNAAGVADANGTYLKVTSETAIASEESPMVTTNTCMANSGLITYVENQTQPQDLILCTATQADPVQAFFKVYAEQATGGLLITKTDALNGAKISGASYRVYGWDGSAYTVDYGLMTDNGDGTYSMGELPVTKTNQGRFKAVEVTAAYGYENGDGSGWSRETTITPGETTQEACSEQPILGDIYLTKEDSLNGGGVEGATFHVYEWNGSSYANDMGTMTDNGDGTYTMENLRVTKTNQGKYRIIETAAPLGFMIGTNGNWSKDIEVTETKTYEVECEEAPYIAVADLEKVDGVNGEKVTGAVYHVYGWTSKGYTTDCGLMIDNGDGTYSMYNLPINAANKGKYKIVEEKAPYGYENGDGSGWSKEVVLTAGQRATVTSIDMPILGTIKIIKSDAVSGKAVTGATYHVYGWDGKDYTVDMGVMTDNGDGTYTMDGLRVTTINRGKYRVVETEAAYGYKIGTTGSWSAEIEVSETRTYEVECFEQPIWKIRIYKTGDQVTSATEYESAYGSFKRLDFGQKPLAGAVFEIYDADGNLVDTVTSGADGYAVSKELSAGTYYIKEIATKHGLILTDKVYEVEVGADDEVMITDISIENAVGDTEINVYKQGEILNVADGTYSFGKKPLAGVIFGVYAGADILDYDGNVVIKKGECVGYIKTGADGKATLKDALVEGSYYYQEVSTLDGYVLDTEEKPFMLVLGNEELTTFEVNKENPDVNQLYKAKIQMVKTDRADHTITLSGVSFELYQVTADGDILMGTYQTDESGTIRIDGLPLGEYYFKEVKSADGYILDDSHIAVIVNGDSDEINISFANEKIPDSPKTGDGAPIQAAATGAILFGSLAAGLWFSRRKKQ